jgi:hypothetical protein
VHSVFDDTCESPILSARPAGANFSLAKKRLF